MIKPQSTTGNVKQVFLNQKGLTIENLKKLLSGSSASGDTLSTLTTLTTSSNANGRSSNADADAVKWLETQGLAMSESDSLVDSALESGKSLNLTEAGKLTLNWVKNQNVNPSSSGAGGKKIITVNNSGKSGTPIILVSSASGGESQRLTAAVAAATRKPQQQLSTQKINLSKPVTIAMIPSSNSVTFARNARPKAPTSCIDLDEEQEEGEEGRLRRQLEQERQQFKQQLADKDREIDKLKKLLADLTPKAGKK